MDGLSIFAVLFSIAYGTRPSNLDGFGFSQRRNAAAARAVFRVALTRFCSILLLWTACAPAQIVQGTVVNSINGAPIAGVKVDLYWSGDRAYSTTSDAQGRFLFDHVKDGVYTAGYSVPDFEWDDMFQGGIQRFQVVQGTPVKLEAHMMPMGHLTGRVVDGRGQPVPGALVEVVGPGMQIVTPADDHAKFDLHRFMFAGGYRLSAAAPAGFPGPEPDPETGAARAWTHTYYPGVADQEAVQEIVLPPGGEVRDIELKLLATPAHAVRGVLLGVDGKPMPKAAISLSGSLAPLHATTGADGAFEFPSVVDRRGYLTANLDKEGVKLRARQLVEVTGRDREGIELRLYAPFTITGKAVAETPQGMVALRPRFVTLSQMDRTRGIGFERTDLVQAQTEPNGEFTLRGVYPDSYDITALGPPGYYLATIRQGGTELTEPKLDLAPGAPPITVVFRSDGGTVRGSVEDCQSGGVVLIPQDPAQRWPDHIDQQRCKAGAGGSDNSRYEFSAVRPGDYYVMAIAKDRLAIFWDPNWNEDMLRLATSVTVRAGEVTSKDLRAIARR